MELPPAEGMIVPGVTTAAAPPLTTAPVTGWYPGARLGVRGVPVFSV